MKSTGRKLRHKVNRISVTQKSRQIAPQVANVKGHTTMTSRKKRLLHAKVASDIPDNRDILLTTVMGRQ